MNEPSTPPAPRLWPRISVLLPVHDPALADLERAVASVEEQVWPNRELCVVDDGSRDSDVRAWLDELRAREGVRFVRHDEARGIAGATNAAIDLATGDFLLLLDHDDELDRDAMDRIVRAVRRDPDVDLLYSDHDLVDVSGRRIGIDLKPGWSPELLLSYMYVGHLKLVRATLARELGGYRDGFEGAADYDFALRLAERAPKVVHVPSVLYHWRAAERSIARSSELKEYAFESGRRALQSALDRRGLDARAEWPGWSKRSRIGVFHVQWRATRDVPVAVVVLARGSDAGRRDCLESLSRSDPARRPTVTTVDASAPAEALRDAVRALTEDFVVFLDEACLVATPGFVDELLGFAMLDGVGAVGAKIVDEDGRIRHAGTVLGIDGGAASAYEGRADVHRPLEHGYGAHTPRNCSGVSKRAMLIRRDRFLDVGGFDDGLRGSGHDDTDLCIKLLDKGYRVVLNPYAEVVLVGDATAPPARSPALRERWGERLDRDPYYHPAFTRLRADYTLRTRRREHDSKGRPLPVPDATDWSELVDAQALRIEALEGRLALRGAAARRLAALRESRAGRWLETSRLGVRLRARLRGTALERRLKALLARGPR